LPKRYTAYKIKYFEDFKCVIAKYDQSSRLNKAWPIFCST
jgi:hypothetical protein